jgi:hypothetical protein
MSGWDWDPSDATIILLAFGGRGGGGGVLFFSFFFPKAALAPPLVHFLVQKFFASPASLKILYGRNNKFIKKKELQKCLAIKMG